MYKSDAPGGGVLPAGRAHPVNRSFLLRSRISPASRRRIDTGRLRRWLSFFVRVSAVVLIASAIFVGVFLYNEVRTNKEQARLLSEIASHLNYRMESGRDKLLIPPESGPYDIRLGYRDSQSFQSRLRGSGFYLDGQARLSAQHARLVESGLFRIYREKSQAGLLILDQHQNQMYQNLYPQRIYKDFGAVPKLVLLALQFVEDRELLDFSEPFRNPVVDWERLVRAVWLQLLKKIGFSERSIGASTVATQLEKMRHSPGGITQDSGDKLQQMLSATLRVYRNGPDTVEARQRLALDYLNAMPLAAVRGYGEINSLADGLTAWYGSDFDEVNRVLNDEGAPLQERALYFKQVLSLVLAVRRPAYYLGQDRTALERLCDSYLRRMALDGQISPALRDAALAQRLPGRTGPPAKGEQLFSEHKGVNLVRSRLLPLLGVDSLYRLDRLDLTVQSTLDAEVQEKVSRFLSELGSKQRIQELGLTGDRLMSASDPSKVIYSMTLYERTVDGNQLRVNADNLDRPFDVNTGAKLDLGSTAKLRTLITWLELISDAYEQIRQAQAAGNTVEFHVRDKLGNWVARHMREYPSDNLQATLEAAMQRRFSASPTTNFYTGGGLHSFANFERTDNTRILTVAEGLRRSVNLVFIRVMREVVNRYMYRGPESTARLLEQADDPRRADYLRRFADREGTQFMSRFYQKYAGKTRAEALQLLLDGVHVSPKTLTVILRSLSEVYSATELAPWLARYTPDEKFTDKQLDSLFERYDTSQFDLNDRGYLARVHPLELWVLEYLDINPAASLADTLKDGAAARQEVYRWLMKTNRRWAQDRRILDLLEIEAFQQIHQDWKRLGYPFASLTPSLATSIGSSGDRPAALAELMGVIVSEGEHYENQLVSQIQFATGTPYESSFKRRPAVAVPVMRPEVASVVRDGLIDVVENGTARALSGALLKPDGSRHIAGGKTGTGDHRFEVYAGPGRLLESRVVNRVATFVFMIDDRFFGTITAFVPGADAANYKFTSGLPVRLLAALMPTLAPLLDSPPGVLTATRSRGQPSGAYY